VIEDKDKETVTRVFQSLQSMVSLGAMLHPQTAQKPELMVSGVGMFIVWFCSEILQPQGDHKKWIDGYFETLKKGVHDAIDAEALGD
jgi:hypothetical protein